METHQLIKTNLSLATTRLPHYFYDLSHPRRFSDPYTLSHNDGELRLILSEEERREKNQRDLVYRAWLHMFDLKPKHCKFQRVRVVRDKWAESTHWDWWKGFQDALFTVFVSPETLYYKKEWIQFYVICPEDCELISRYLWEKKNSPLPPRVCKYISEDKRLRVAYVVPTRCCSQLRNETKGGIPENHDLL